MFHRYDWWRRDGGMWGMLSPPDPPARSGREGGSPGSALSSGFTQEAHPLGVALLTWSPGDRPRHHRAFILRGTLQIQPTSLGAGATPTSSVAVDPQPETSYGKTRSTPRRSLTTSLFRVGLDAQKAGIYPRQAWLAHLEICIVALLLVEAENASAAACLQGGNAVVGLGHDVLLSLPNTNHTGLL